MGKFNLEEYLENPNRKVVTRDVRPVRIVCTNSPIPHHPIVGFVECNLFTWTDDGKVIYGGKCEDKNDLFFADKEEDLTEFEKEVAEAYEWTKTTEREDFVNEFAPKLLDLARKEILKDLLKWKKAKRNLEFNKHIVINEDDRVSLTTEVYKGEYYIDPMDLLKLPKEE